MLVKIFDWASIVGAAASIIGVWVGVCALRAANRAERAAKAAGQAAREATEAARRGHAAEELSNLSSIAKEIVEFVEAEQWGQASVRAGDLLFEVTHCVERWERFFSTGGKKKFRDLRTKLSVLKHLLVGVPANDAQREQASEVAYEALLTRPRQMGTIVVRWGDLEVQC